jgi:hypothetical protein
VSVGDLVLHLLMGKKLRNLRSHPDFEIYLEAAKWAARVLLSEIGDCVDTDGKTVAEVLDPKPIDDVIAMAAKGLPS